MPVEGYKSVTVKDKTYNELQELADKTHRSISGTIEYLLEKYAPISIEITSEVPANG